MTKHTNSKSQRSSDLEYDCDSDFEGYNSLGEIDSSTFKTNRKCHVCHRKKPTMRLKYYYNDTYSLRVCFRCLYDKCDFCSVCRKRLLKAFWKCYASPPFKDALVYQKSQLQYTMSAFRDYVFE